MSVLFLGLLLWSCLVDSDQASLSIHVSPALPGTWLVACGRRVPVDPGAWPVRVSLPPGEPCALVASRDDHGAIVRSEMLHLIPRAGQQLSRVLSLPEPGGLGTPGFTLVPGPGGARVLPFPHTPRDLQAPHPAWLEGVEVHAIDGLPTAHLDAIELDRLAHGSPGTRLWLDLVVPVASVPIHLPLERRRGTAYRVPFTRQRPKPWASGAPPPGLVAAWTEEADPGPVAVAARMERWRLPGVRTSRAAGRSPASPPPGSP